MAFPQSTWIGTASLRILISDTRLSCLRHDSIPQETGYLCISELRSYHIWFKEHTNALQASFGGYAARAPTVHLRHLLRFEFATETVYDQLARIPSSYTSQTNIIYINTSFCATCFQGADSWRDRRRRWTRLCEL